MITGRQKNANMKPTGNTLMMNKRIVVFLVVIVLVVWGRKYNEESMIQVFDLTRPTTWKDLSNFYDAVSKNWKICVNCGVPGLGTSIHLEHGPTANSLRPAVIPPEYLLTRLVIIDASYIYKRDEHAMLSLEIASQWNVLKRDPREPTLILFRFNWVDTNIYKQKCVCKIPGLSYELAEWIARNLTHVVGVATDAPSLESPQTREMVSHTVSDVLGRAGVYMIENVRIPMRVPARGCMAVAMPLMLLEPYHLPTRLVVICPSQKTDHQITIALRKSDSALKLKSRNHDNYNEFLN